MTNTKQDTPSATALTPQVQAREQTGHTPVRVDAPPKFIKVTITEEDRQAADQFGECESCVIATAFRRAGYNVWSVGGFTMGLIFEGRSLWTEYNFDCDCGELQGVDKYKQRPFYSPSVVGRVISVTLREGQ